ncbi:MAG: gas vesicle protein GvpO [Bacillota bacterium]
MGLEKAVTRAKNYLEQLTGLLVERVIGAGKTDQGWQVVLEAVERKAVPDLMDIIGIYEMELDVRGRLLGYERKNLRKRGETCKAE